ncbi:MAG: PQQ-binding-like beta-propeller repeat protein [Kiritimatiellae bacterium]|nr:PQQ-binding-like beta-propeller repeat protein [Kiritimatiellia bacterium]
MNKTRLIQNIPIISFLVLLNCLSFNNGISLAADHPTDELAHNVLQHIGSPRGICVVLGDPNCELALKLARSSELLVYVQLPNMDAVEKARKNTDTEHFYGNRIFIEQGPLSRLHLASNLADALVLTRETTEITEEEVLRVLRPQGKAWIGKKEIIKPCPIGVDDWSHPYHGPDNNPASQDQIARGPYLTQFLADPRYAPLPQVAVASAGRVFKVFGHIAFKEREEPWLNTMAAFNGYNGAFLWRREIPSGIMIHRNTIIATPTVVYYGDDKSCKVINALTGQLEDEIIPPEKITGGTFWKWMALEDGILFAMVGEQEQKDPIVCQKREAHGWPWNPLSPGFNQPDNPWGFGRSILAINPKTKKILWHHNEEETIDSRALCMSSGRIFLFHHGSFLVCLNAKSGREIWRKTVKNSPELFETIGMDLKRQDWRTNWRTAAYLKASEKVLYFAGPMISKLIAVSTEDGRVLWQHPYSNYQLVLQGGALYGLSGINDTELSRKFDPLTGNILSEYQYARSQCTRPVGSIDAIFCRALGGSSRLDIIHNKPQMVSPMRAQCHDGITIANGLLYWWPSTCDCNISLYGITCLGPAGSFNFEETATEPARLVTGRNVPVSDDSVSPADWPAFRANHSASATTDTVIPTEVRKMWEYVPPTGTTPTAPTAANGMIFWAGSDGIVRAMDAVTGKLVWTVFTGGAIRFPPTIWKGRVFVGSGDGWVYSLEMRTGNLLWRFRAAPIERRIPVYGQIMSTWPVASGVLVHDGIAYFASGIANYDGTYVYALDAITGRIRWQNTSSGHLYPEVLKGRLDMEELCGESVQGNMIINDGKLYMAGGNVVSPAMYDITNGKCLNDPGLPYLKTRNNILNPAAPRGSELYLVGNVVRVGDQPLYAHPKYKVYDNSVLYKTWVGSMGDRDVAWLNNSKVFCFQHAENNAQRFNESWGKPGIQGLKPLWEVETKDSVAVALCKNAVVIASKTELIALSLQDGKKMWTQSMPAVPVNWGLATDKDGRIVVCLENGQISCFDGK